MKTCNKCQIEQSFDQFTKDLKSKDGRRHVCKSCVSKDIEARNNVNPEEWKILTKERNIWNYYKLTPEQYKERTKSGCEVCDSMENLCIDHDHNCCPGVRTCGKCLRGTLCHTCNVAEGMLKSDANRAFALAAYIIKNEKMNLIV